MYGVYLIIVVLGFGFLIATHELGHFLAARAFDVKVNEFAIGMGPTLWSWQGKETKYSLKLLPLGGYCAMEGENGDSDDARSLGKQAAWKRMVVFVAGAAVNLFTGFLVAVIVIMCSAGITTSEVALLADTPNTQALQVGDTVKSMDGHKIFIGSDVVSYLASGDTHDFVVERDGETLEISGVYLPLDTYRFGDKEVSDTNGIVWAPDMDISFTEGIRYGAGMTASFVRSVYSSLWQLVTGQVGLSDMAGVVGATDVMARVATDTQETAVANGASALEAFSRALRSLFLVLSLIAVNLAAMNLLPIPALDGGQIAITAVNLLMKKTVHREIPEKAIQMASAVSLILLLVLLGAVMVMDTGRIIFG